jgi:hypothetical protein
MDGKVLGGRLWWIFMVFMSAVNFVSALFVAEEPSKTRLEPVYEEDEEEE